MTLTFSLTTPHLTADTELEQHVSSGTAFAFANIFQNKNLASEKHLQLHLVVVVFVSF